MKLENVRTTADVWRWGAQVGAYAFVAAFLLALVAGLVVGL